MGKLRIVKQNETFRVEELKTLFVQGKNEHYESWETIKTFFTQSTAETFAENYINRQDDKKPKVVKTYDF